MTLKTLHCVTVTGGVGMFTGRLEKLCLRLCRDSGEGGNYVGINTELEGSDPRI